MIAQAPTQASPQGATPPPPRRAARSTRERLHGVLRHHEEALSPRALRRTLAELQAVADPRVSEVEGGRRAQSLAQWYGQASAAQRRDCWLLMSEQFAPDPQRVKMARERYELAAGTAEEGAAEAQLRRALASPRQRLLQRFASYPQGMRFLVDLRAEVQPHLKTDRRLLALDAELESLLSTWFDVALLELRRISWDSPASLIEKLIQYEAVHDIHGWSDVKNRLDSDRRCYGFFHPHLPGEPLIFVEVALTTDTASAIGPLLDESAALSDASRATTAVFYSISSTQPGLRGVSFGDSLIKRVVETLKAEFPRLRTFVTLSPIPGLRAWLQAHEGTELVRALDALATHDAAAALDERHPLRRLALAATARYLGQMGEGGQPLDPVARFHLGNGARVERVNWAADASAKGWRQSFGIMVNYLYDLRRLDRHRAQLAQGKIPMAAHIEGM